MKKIYSLIVVAILGTTTMFAQGFGTSFDYAMWDGTMIENAESTSSVILGLNYTHSLSKKMDVVGSAGYGMGFGVTALKTDLNYGITSKISANVGMGIYIISDDTYETNSSGVDGADPSFNEFGTNLGLSYQVTSAIALGFNYNMIKGGDYDFNGMQFGLSYAFGSKSSDKKEEKENK